MAVTKRTSQKSKSGGEGTQKRKKTLSLFSPPVGGVLRLVPRPVPQRLPRQRPISTPVLLSSSSPLLLGLHGLGRHGRVGGPLPSQSLPRVGRRGHRRDELQQRRPQVVEVLFAVGVLEIGAGLVVVWFVDLMLFGGREKEEGGKRNRKGEQKKKKRAGEKQNKKMEKKLTGTRSLFPPGA